MKEYTFNEDFEMVYLRHEYLEKCESLDGRFVTEYAPVVNRTCQIMYDKLWPTYNKAGFHKEDIIAICNMYLLGYMGVYSMRFNKRERDKFVRKYRTTNKRPPTDKEIYNADRNNLINFLRQRLQHLSTVCARKARNILGTREKTYIFAHTDHSKPVSNEDLIERHKEFGYRKVTQKEFKESKKKAKALGEKTLTDKDGYKLVIVEILSRPLKREEYQMIVDTQKSTDLMSPEEIMMHQEDEAQLNIYKDKFYQLTPKRQKSLLRKFLKKNKGNKLLKEEMRTARKILKNKEIMV